MRGNVPKDSLLQRNREDRKFKKAFKELSSRKTDTEALTSRVQVVEGDVGTLQSDVGTLQTDTSTLRNDVDNLTASSVGFDNTNNATGTSFASVQEAIDYILNNYS